MVRRKSDNYNYSLRKWRGGRIFLITIESLKGASLLGDRGIDRFFSLSLSVSFHSSYPAGVRWLDLGKRDAA